MAQMSGSCEDDSSSDGDYYGPAPPPTLQKKIEEASQPQTSSHAVISNKVIVGPEIPKELQDRLKNTKTSSGGQSSKDREIPSTTNTKQVVIGPVLPSNFNPKEGKDSEESDESLSTVQPLNSRNNDSSESDSDEDIIGPLPPDHPKALELSRRHGSSKVNDEEKSKKKLQREEWMLIPPSNRPVTELGLGPRKFLQRAPEEPVKEGDDALNSDEEFEMETRAAMEQQIIDEYDKSMEAMIEKVGGKRKQPETLMEIHQKELKKKAKAEKEASKAAKNERRPFDRNTDLSVTGLSRDDKKKYIERTRELDGRFHKGRQKFL